MMTRFLLILSCCIIWVSCAEDKSLPKAPDYSDMTQWYISSRGADADMFYVISTEIGDYKLEDGTVRHLADTYLEQTRQPMYGEMLGVDTLTSGKLNYYSPYYRQCSLQSFASDSASIRFNLALDDVRRAFAYYLEHQNNGRPFVLAGFSQGAMIARELLKEMDETVFQRMVATYLVGIRVSETDMQSNPHIRPAKGADDTGVTICYNSMRGEDANYPAQNGNNVFAINPVNWRTDGEVAALITEPSPLKPVAEQQKDTMTVQLDTASNLLLVSGYSATDYVLPILGTQTSYHTREIWLYRDQLKENIQQRVDAFMKGQ
ncbi:MAG: DUF3089 domain-containing protein [Bacteroidaceae bacterium]|nr:DUF3089 domain-containing protein [Bacteroidaceae bacterium]